MPPRKTVGGRVRYLPLCCDIPVLLVVTVSASEKWLTFPFSLVARKGMGHSSYQWGIELKPAVDS